MIKYLQTFWGCLAFGVLMFAIFLITDLTDASFKYIRLRDWLGSVAGATILSVGMFTLNKLNLK